jgi:hypothetical protein
MYAITVPVAKNVADSGYNAGCGSINLLNKYGKIKD